MHDRTGWLLRGVVMIALSVAVCGCKTTTKRQTAAPAAGPATQPAHAGEPAEDGERGRVVRVDQTSLTVKPLPPRPLKITLPLEPERPLPPDAPGEKTYGLDADTAVTIGIVIGEGRTDRGETIRTFELERGALADIRAGREVRVVADARGGARRILVFPLPPIEPASRAVAGATTRRGGPASRAAGSRRGSMFMGGTRGRLLRADAQSITIEPAERRSPGPGETEPPQPQQRPSQMTFRIEQRTRILVPRNPSASETQPTRGRQRVTFEPGRLDDLKPGQDVAIAEGDEGVAMRVTIMPEGFGARRTRSPATTRPSGDGGR